MSLLNDTMVIYNQKPLWVIVLIYCLTVFVCFLSCSYNYRRLSIYSSVRTEDSTTAALCQMSIRLETPPLTFPFRWGSLWQVKLRMHMLCTDFFKFVGFHQTPFQNSELDTSRTTRHHGLVDRVYRERNRITSPHCRPLSVDKHGRQISLMSLLMKADKCFDLCGLRKHICFKCLRFTYPDIMKSLMLNLTLIAVRMPLCICHPHLIPAGGGESLYSQSACMCWRLYICAGVVAVEIACQ